MSPLAINPPREPQARPIGLIVGFYPARISDEALWRLREVSATALYESAPAFTAWLTTWCDEEIMRRMDAERGDAAEADLPILPVDWDDRDLAGALTATHSLSYSLKDPTAGEFIDKLVAAVVALVRSRLLERHHA